MRRAMILIVALAVLVSACAEAGDVPIVESTAPDTSVVDDGSASESTSENSVESDEPIEIENEETDDTAGPVDDTVPVEKPEPTAPAQTTPEPTPVSTEATQPPRVGEVPEGLLDSILADAGSMTKAPLTVIRAEAVTWSDGSLGCPEPGVLYTQALVDGYWVVLDAGGAQLDYRATGNGSFKLCVDSMGTPPTVPSS